MNKNQSDCAQILAHLKRGRKITAAGAWQIGCTRLAARIYDLRKAGYNVSDEWVKPRCGNRFKRYTLA